MYLNWSQYIVIWYGLLPHEQEFFVQRFSEPFGAIAGAVVLLVFVLPFFGLLTRPPKKVLGILAFFATIILVGRLAGALPAGLPLALEGDGGAARWACRRSASASASWASSWRLPLVPAARVPILPSPATLAARGSPVVAVPVPATAES